MDISHIEHIGIAVKNLDESIKLYENILGMKCYRIEEVKDQKVRTAFFKIGQTKLELLEPTDTTSPINKFIEKRGEGLHHIALNVDNVNTALNELFVKGIKLIDEKARDGAEGLQIGFVHPKSANGVLLEFCSSK
ncbi:4-hydroxyphenylpyruvate dioxygenase [bacterium BMS3Abin04]|nr:4-hydroxyphenylpyruvate dioxygenase [bacterium BMS3Abin04]